MNARTIKANTAEEIDAEIERCFSFYDDRFEEMLALGKTILERTIALKLANQQAKALIACGSAAYRLEETAEHLRYYGELAEIVGLLHPPAFRAKVLAELARTRRQYGDEEGAMKYLIEARELLMDDDDPSTLSQVNDLIGNELVRLGEFEQALSYLLPALQMRHEQKLYRWEIDSLHNVGNVYGELGDMEKALEYYHRGMELSRKYGNEEGMSFALIACGMCYVTMGSAAEAIASIEKGIRLLTPPSDRLEMSNALDALATAYEMAGRNDDARRCYEKAREIADRRSFSVMRAVVRGNLAMMLMKSGELDEAERLLGEAETISSQNDIPLERIGVVGKMSQLHLARGDYKRAYELHYEYARLREEYFSAERVRAVAAADLRHSLANAERQRELLRLRAEQAERESEQKTKELTAIALQLTQRNEALKALKQTVLPYNEKDNGGNELAAKILGEIAEATGGGKEWQVFQEQFEQVYHDFIQALRRQASSLTPAEIRICVLIKMNLSTKQIADLLFSSELTVKTHRTRIRKKLGMRGSDNLGSLLLAL